MALRTASLLSHALASIRSLHRVCRALPPLLRALPPLSRARFPPTSHRTFASTHGRASGPAPPLVVPPSPSKPRVAPGRSTPRVKRRPFLRLVVLSLPLALAALAVFKSGGVQPALLDFKSYLSTLRDLSAGRALSDPSMEELERALGGAVPEGYIHLLLTLDDLILTREWDRRHGWRVRLRPGVKEALGGLTELGCMITFWSNASASSAGEVVSKMAADLSIPLSITPLHLGVEHCFGLQHAKQLAYFNRPLRSMLLVDFNPLSLDGNRDNCVLLSSFKSAEEAGGEDTGLKSLLAIVARIRRDASGRGGVVDVPASLSAIRAEAAAAGFDSDAAGVYKFMSVETAREAERERERKETGVGGLMRRTLHASPLFAGRMTTAEAAAVRSSSSSSSSSVAEGDTLLARSLAKKTAQLQAMYARPGAGPGASQ